MLVGASVTNGRNHEYQNTSLKKARYGKGNSSDELWEVTRLSSRLGEWVGVCPARVRGGGEGTLQTTEHHPLCTVRDAHHGDKIKIGR